ncbi:MAG: hypothetical protein KTR24_05980 [Saprospiraceae bacterium]|nr:hypothetical protein [Saprospiraceae bacterium]
MRKPLHSVTGPLFLLFVLFAQHGFSQVITVSREINLRAEFVYDILGSFDDQILLIRDGINEFDLQAFDRSLRQTWDKEEKLDSRKSRIIDIIEGQNSFRIVYSDEFKDTLMVKVRTYDPNAKLLSLDTIHTMRRGLIRPKFRFNNSEDENIFLMSLLENERMVASYCYDFSQRRKLWESEFEFKDINFREEYRKTLISNEGTMYIVFEKNNIRFRKSDHSMGVFRFDKERNQFDLIAIPMPEFTTYDAHFIYDNVNNHLVMLGLHSDRNTGNTDGLFHIIIKDREFLAKPQLSMVDYSEELIADFHGKYESKRESLNNLEIQDVILRQDGGILIIAEESKEFERLSYGARRDFYGSSRFSVDYYYEDIILMAINPDGTSHWQKLLPKRQYSNDDDAVYSSYFLFSNPTYLRILYNDEIRNENTVSEYVLNGGGDITRRSLMSTDNQKLRLQIKNAVQLSSDELIIPSVRGRKLKLVKLQY